MLPIFGYLVIYYGNLYCCGIHTGSMFTNVGYVSYLYFCMFLILLISTDIKSTIFILMHVSRSKPVKCRDIICSIFQL